MSQEKREPIKIMMKTLVSPVEESIKESEPFLKQKKSKTKVNKTEAEAGYHDNRRERKHRGDMLKYLRDAKGLSQVACASLLGTSSVYYMNIERGNVDVSLSKLDYWLSVLGGKLIIFPNRLI